MIVAEFRIVVATKGQTSRRNGHIHYSHARLDRGIQYAAASRFNHCCLRVLDRPVLVRNCALAGR
ncbi:hypothetical protein EAS56_02750 [Bradyrhizobium guangzhouense]|uniref:Uncharacterized protein n=1 Tax=Bradyrhizobium guangzhouense TaxID=1325095 RepID=A0AAE5WVS9_9BRAD|nr:hypothetical protein XH91_00090 [Bradyrhizobium guangzhouense]RXH18001.1 hypothetical protein EAS56_02750 [Bradyrhizobium guangzhouense]